MLDTPREVLFSEPVDGEGWLDFAPAAWLVLLGRCLRCFEVKAPGNGALFESEQT